MSALTEITQRVPVDRITREARDVDVRRTLLTLVAAVFYAIGWVAGKTFVVVWAAVVWSAVAVKVGWDDARASMPVDRGGG